MSAPLKPQFFHANRKNVENTRCDVPIPNNQSCFFVHATALPPQVRDLAELLAQIAADELMQEQAARKESGQ